MSTPAPAEHPYIASALSSGASSLDIRKFNEEEKRLLRNMAACSGDQAVVQHRDPHHYLFKLYDANRSDANNLRLRQPQKRTAVEEGYTTLVSCGAVSFSGGDSVSGVPPEPVFAQNMAEFETNFCSFTKDLLVGMNWGGVLAAGGSIANCVQSRPMTGAHDHQLSKDVDLFLWGLEDEAECLKKIRHIYDTVVGNFQQQRGGGGAFSSAAGMGGAATSRATDDGGGDHGPSVKRQRTSSAGDAKGTSYEDLQGRWALEGLKDSGVLVVRSASAITIVLEHPYPLIQIILNHFSSPAEVLTVFDLDCCCVGYDGQHVWLAPRAHNAHTKKFNLVDLERRNPVTFETRLAKYARRGFDVLMPAEYVTAHVVANKLQRTMQAGPTLFPHVGGRAKWGLEKLLCSTLPEEAGAGSLPDAASDEEHSYGGPVFPWETGSNAESVFFYLLLNHTSRVTVDSKLEVDGISGASGKGLLFHGVFFAATRRWSRDPLDVVLMTQPHVGTKWHQGMYEAHRMAEEVHSSLRKVGQIRRNLTNVPTIAGPVRVRKCDPLGYLGQRYTGSYANLAREWVG